MTCICKLLNLVEEVAIDRNERKKICTNYFLTAKKIGIQALWLLVIYICKTGLSFCMKFKGKY